ncbi:MAG: hypothetical protein AB7O04_11860 [Hyphomonadaceae bacterium]
MRARAFHDRWKASIGANPICAARIRDEGSFRFRAGGDQWAAARDDQAGAFRGWLRRLRLRFDWRRRTHRVRQNRSAASPPAALRFLVRREESYFFFFAAFFAGLAAVFFAAFFFAAMWEPSQCGE